MRQSQEERTGGAASRASAASGGQSREEFFAGRRAGRRADSPQWIRARAKDARSVHLGDGLSAGAREKPRSGLLPAASRSGTLTVAQEADLLFMLKPWRQTVGAPCNKAVCRGTVNAKVCCGKQYAKCAQSVVASRNAHRANIRGGNVESPMRRSKDHLLESVCRFA